MNSLNARDNIVTSFCIAFFLILSIHVFNLYIKTESSLFSKSTSL